MSQYDTRSTVINTRPQYVQDVDEALLARIFGAPLVEGQEYISGYDEQGDPIYKTATEEDVAQYGGTLFGGMIDDPELFNIPDYVQAGADPLQAAVTSTLGDADLRQEFMDRDWETVRDHQSSHRIVSHHTGLHLLL